MHKNNAVTIFGLKLQCKPMMIPCISSITRKSELHLIDDNRNV